MAYDIFTSRDTTHEGPQWWAEVIETTAEGTEVENAEPVYATSWHPTERDAEEEAKGWLWANRHRPPTPRPVKW